MTIGGPETKQTIMPHKTHEDGYIYPNRKEFMESLADQIKARVAPASIATFCDELKATALEGDQAKP